MRSSHVRRHLARPPDHLPVSYYLADAALSASQSAIRPPICSPGSCSTCRRPPPLLRLTALFTSPVDRPFDGTRSLLSSRRDAAAIDCPLFPWSRVDISVGHPSTCGLMVMAAVSSLDHIRIKSVQRVLQSSVTVEFNFFWF